MHLPLEMFQTPKNELNDCPPGGHQSKEFSRSKIFSGANAPPKRTHWRMAHQLVDLMATLSK